MSRESSRTKSNESLSSEIELSSGVKLSFAAKLSPALERHLLSLGRSQLNLGVSVRPKYLRRVFETNSLSDDPFPHDQRQT